MFVIVVIFRTNVKYIILEDFVISVGAGTPQTVNGTIPSMSPTIGSFSMAHTNGQPATAGSEPPAAGAVYANGMTQAFPARKIISWCLPAAQST